MMAWPLLRAMARTKNAPAVPRGWASCCEGPQRASSFLTWYREPGAPKLLYVPVEILSGLHDWMRT